MSKDHLKEIKHYTCENCGKLDLFKCMGTGLCEDCLQYLMDEAEEETKETYDDREVLYKLVDKMMIPYANDKGGYSCRNCDTDVFYNEKKCPCGQKFDWSDND